MHVKYYRKNVFVENVWPANLALFVYVSTHCVETVKWLDYNRYSQLTRCNLLTAITSRVATVKGSNHCGEFGPGGAVVTHPLWVQEVPGSIPGCGKGFYVCFFVLLLLCFYFLSKNTLFIEIYCNSFYNVNLFSILNVLQDL